MAVLSVELNKHRFLKLLSKRVMKRLEALVIFATYLFISANEN